MNLKGQITNPGEMRTYVNLQQRTSVSGDAGGFQQKTYTDAASVWAKWTNFHGSEAITASSAGIQEGATVLIRYRADIDETWRVVKGGLIYEVISIDNIQERNEYQEIKVKRTRPG
jgi:SPP1 family predicted phage head-tail adaptor